MCVRDVVVDATHCDDAENATKQKERKNKEPNNIASCTVRYGTIYVLWRGADDDGYYTLYSLSVITVMFTNCLFS